MPRTDGGGHDPENLTVICDGHHAAHHRGVLAISGTALDKLLFARFDSGTDSDTSEPARVELGADFEMSHVGHGHATAQSISSKFAAAQLRTDLRSALKNLGWKPHDVARGADAALGALGTNASIQELVIEALRILRTGW